MKIAQFIDTDTFGGAEVLVADLSRALVERGFELEVLTFGRNQRLLERCRQSGLRTITLSGYGSYKHSYSLPAFALSLRATLVKHRIDLLHTHLLGPAIGGGLAAIGGMPHVATLHDFYSLEGRSWMLRTMKFLGGCGTEFVAVSELMERFIREQGGVNSIHTIYNGIEIWDANPETRIAIRQELQIPEGCVLCAVVGRLVKLKGHRLLLEALKTVTSTNDWRVLIVGEGPEHEELARLIKEYRLESKVSLLGHRNDVSKILTAADLFALTSSTEGLSYSILEAMAAGLPILATEVGGNSELVRSEVNGVLVKREASELATSFSRLVNDSAHRSSYGIASREIVKTKFSFSQMVNQYTELYNSMVRG